MNWKGKKNNIKKGVLVTAIMLANSAKDHGLQKRNKLKKKIGEINDCLQFCVDFSIIATFKRFVSKRFT